MTKKVVWDPGHRNNALDWGASGNGLREAEIAMTIANHADKYLKNNYSGFESRFTRSSNSQIIGLDQRDDVADNWGADVFVSIHLNAAAATARGFETFIYDGILPGDKKTPLLQTLVHDEIVNAMKPFGQIIDRGKKRKNLAVLRDTNMPAILTENLFISNAYNAGFLKDDKFLQAVGKAHAVGVAKYLGLPSKTVVQPKPPAPNKPTQPDYIGSTHEKAIVKAMKKGALKGYANGNFGPNDPLTRGQLATVLDRLGLLD